MRTNKTTCSPLNLTSGEMSLVNNALVNYRTHCEKSLWKAKLFSPRHAKAVEKCRDMTDDVLQKLSKVMSKKGL